MCPDTQLFSIYVDGELPSPWKEKLEAHVEQCSACGEKLYAYKQLRETVRDDLELKGIEEAKDKAWQNLSSRIKVSEDRELIRLRNKESNTYKRLKLISQVWRQRISIPLPAAAAAVILIIFAVFWLRGNPKAAPVADVNSGVVLAADEVPGIIPADMSSVLKYLDTERADVIILRLPESRNFMSSGEPAIIKAADYSRRYP